MRDGTKIVLLVGLLLIAALFLFTRASRENRVPAALSELPASELPASTPTATPSGDNVSPTFHVEIARLEQRLAEAPADTAALAKIGQMLHDAHRSEEALAYYERYLAINPLHRQILLDVSNLHAGLQQWDRAEEATQALLRAYPDDPAALYNLGAIAANRGDFAAARSWWERARDQQTDPDMAARAVASLKRIAPHP